MENIEREYSELERVGTDRRRLLNGNTLNYYGDYKWEQ
jgi:hypothetical protein